MDDVLTLFFAVVFGEGLLDQHKFLFLAQAIEGYHRAQSGSKNKRFTTSEFKKRRDIVLKLIPDDQIDWVSEALEYPPNTPLAQRLNELTESLKGFVSALRRSDSETCQAANASGGGPRTSSATVSDGLAKSRC
jgi:Apea-like HEPN